MSDMQTEDDGETASTQELIDQTDKVLAEQSPEGSLDRLNKQLARTARLLEEIRNYQGSQLQMQSSQSLDLNTQLDAIHHTSEQVNQALTNSLRQLDTSSKQQRQASEQVIQHGYKAFQDSVERTANRNEQQLKQLQSEQRNANERLLKLQHEQNAKLDSLAQNTTRHLDQALASLDRKTSQQIKQLGDRLNWHQIRNWLVVTIPTSVITSGILWALMCYRH
jgi:DNA anti-recombination protein RmuC